MADPDDASWPSESAPSREIISLKSEVDQQTVVIEGGVVKKRLRRPLDLLRLVVALGLIVVFGGAAYFATGTAIGIGEDITEASRKLPDMIVAVLNGVGGLGLLTLPVAAAVDLLIRHRGRQLLDAVVALIAAIAVLTAVKLILEDQAGQMLLALSGGKSPPGTPLLPLLGGLVAFITVARLMGRSRWNIAAGAVVISLVVFTVITGGIAIAGIAESLLIGWATGLAMRYVFGTPTTRPSGLEVAAALAKAGHPISLLRAQEITEVGRRYSGVEPDGTELEVFVLDRDLEGAGAAQAAWRSLRLRDDVTRGAVNMRHTLEHRALLAYAAEVARAPSAKLVAAREIGPDSSLLAYERVLGKRFSALAVEEITDDILDDTWRVLLALRNAGITHRRLTASNLVLTPTGQVRLLGIGSGSVASSDVALRIDLAEMMCTLALLVGPDRSVASGRRVLGSDTMATALPVLQPVALSPETKKAIRKNKDVMISLRDAIVEIRPDADAEHIELERIKPRVLIMIILGSIAAYALLSQLGQVDLVTLLTNANWEWMIVAVIASLMTYPGAAWSLTGFVPERLKFHRTIAAQLSADFATLVAPPTLGTVAINLRYLQRSGVHPALATASIGVSQVGALLVHLILLTGFGIAAGSQQDFKLLDEAPPGLLLAGAAAIAIVGGLFLLPPVRHRIKSRFGPMLKQVGPRLITVAQRPGKLAEGIGGMLVLNLGYIVCLVACVKAFGGEIGFSAVAVVYLTGSVVGQAAPTPGGLGAVEAAMAAGLTAAGLSGGLAVSAVLLYRLITFWAPTVPGWFTFNWLQKSGYL
ncbi:MAG: lysylphosphatidylglycerol synthase transmembrane domain-containing protein [Candidatus Nanopelagicales bacterium]|nr:lysylphosphatidylglycerol synthase transmembrane domain-containing protein [Candidatus Nanopelagicales bacterium]